MLENQHAHAGNPAWTTRVSQHAPWAISSMFTLSAAPERTDQRDLGRSLVARTGDLDQTQLLKNLEGSTFLVPRDAPSLRLDIRDDDRRSGRQMQPDDRP
jgi:hypothetical protein